MALAAPPLLSYKHVDPNDSPSDRFDDRGEHLLYMSEVTRKSFGDWVAGMPVRRVVGSDVERLSSTTTNELLLSHVSLNDDARHVGYGEVYIKDEAYSRFAATVLQLRPGEGRVCGAYGTMYEETVKAVAGASEAVKDALTLSAADLEKVQADTALRAEGTDEQIAQALAYNTQLSARGYINKVSHVTKLSREAPGWTTHTRGWCLTSCTGCAWRMGWTRTPRSQRTSTHCMTSTGASTL